MNLASSLAGNVTGGYSVQAWVEALASISFPISVVLLATWRSLPTWVERYASATISLSTSAPPSSDQEAVSKRLWIKMIRGFVVIKTLVFIYSLTSKAGQWHGTFS